MLDIEAAEGIEMSEDIQNIDINLNPLSKQISADKMDEPMYAFSENSIESDTTKGRKEKEDMDSDALKSWLKSIKMDETKWHNEKSY